MMTTNSTTVSVVVIAFIVSLILLAEFVIKRYEMIEVEKTSTKKYKGEVIYSIYVEPYDTKKYSLVFEYDKERETYMFVIREGKTRWVFDIAEQTGYDIQITRRKNKKDNRRDVLIRQYDSEAGFDIIREFKNVVIETRSPFIEGMEKMV